MAKTKTKRRFRLLDGILCVVAVLAIAAASCYFLAADGSALNDYTIAEDYSITGTLAKAALTGEETEVTAPEINRLLKDNISASTEGVQQILVKPSGTENEIEFCIMAQAKGHTWVLSGKGTLIVETEDETVTAFIFSPEKLRLGKLPLSRSLFFSLLQPDILPDGVTVSDEKLSLSASLVPASLAAFRVSENAFVFRPKGPLDQLMDKIDDFAQKTPEEQNEAWNELQQELTEQAEQALAQGSEAFEQFKQQLQEQFSSLDTDQLFSELESGFQSAAGEVESFVEQNGDKISDAVQDFLDALQSETATQG